MKQLQNDIIITEGNNELNIAMVPIPLSIDIAFTFVKNYLVGMLGSVLKNPELVTHLGFLLTNNETSVIDNITARFYITNIEIEETKELLPPLDVYLSAISQPFSVNPGQTSIFYRYGFSPYYDSYRVNVKLFYVGNLIVAKSLDFITSY